MYHSLKSTFVALALLGFQNSTAIAGLSTTECAWKAIRGEPSKITVVDEGRGLLVFHKEYPPTPLYSSVVSSPVDALSCRIRFDCTIEAGSFEGIKFTLRSSDMEYAVGHIILHVGDSAELGYGKEKPAQICKIIGFAAQ